VSIVILLIFITFGLGFFTVKPVVILSGSMEPIIKPGDMVIIRKCDAGEVAVGDIVEYKMPNFNVVHRVIAITYEGGKLGFITKGDANKSPDKTIVNSNQIVGKFVLNIPYVGYPTYLIKNMVDNNEQVDIEQGGANNE
jgi:signal peptidase